MRYIDDGQIIAQCNVVQLPSRPAGNPLKLEVFKKEVAQIIANSEAQVGQSQAYTTESGLDALRVTVKGEESGIPLNWIYYHINNSDGRRVTLVFTFEEEAEDYFKQADRELVTQIQFKKAIATTAAKQPATSARKR